PASDREDRGRFVVVLSRFHWLIAIWSPQVGGWRCLNVDSDDIPTTSPPARTRAEPKARSRSRGTARAQPRDETPKALSRPGRLKTLKPPFDRIPVSVPQATAAIHVNVFREPHALRCRIP